MAGGESFRGSFELVLVRHGRTAWNAAGRYQGHTDIPLDDTGRAQAAALGRELRSIDFDVAVASDLARAFETAQIVLGTRSSILTADPRWRELRFGAWEGLTRPEIVARTPALRANPPARFPTPEGGESFVELVVRVRAALHAVADRTPGGGHALVATHAGPLHAALRLLLGEEEANGLGVTFLPATFTSLAVAPHGSRLIELNRSAS